MEKLSLTPEGVRFMKEWGSQSHSIQAYTSGSTGTPKEIHLLKSDMIQSARATNSFFKIDKNSLLVCPLSANYIAGKMMIVRALEANCRLIMEVPSNFPLNDDYDAIDLLPVVPSQIPGLLTNIQSNHKIKVKNIIVGGAPLSGFQEQQLLKIPHLKSFATYGMTETCSHVALRELGEKEYHAIPGVRFDTDARKCLTVISEGKYSFHHLQTNDVVDLTSNKSFVWKGRADNVIISGGIKLFPEEIERLINSALNLPVNFYLSGRESSKWGQELVMYIEGEESALKSSKEILQSLREILPSTMLPKQIIFMKEFKRTLSGKIIRASE